MKATRIHPAPALLCTAIALAVLAAARPGRAQQPAAQPPAPAPAAASPAPASPAAPAAATATPPPAFPVSRDYVIGPGDLLAVGVFGLPDFAQTVRVSNSGKVHLTHVGIMRVNGRTAGQIESDIAALLRQKELVREPWVIVNVKEMRAHPVYILGEVMMPGQYQIHDQMYLSDLVTMAVGFNNVASPVGFLYRRKANPETGAFDATRDPEAAQMEAIPIDFQALQTGANPALNVKLQAGDILYVPERRKEYYFIIGDVNTPGLFELEPGHDKLLLSQAMARAGGPTRTAKPSKIQIVRYARDGTRQELAVNFGAVMRGREPDLQVQFGDVIFVPGSKMKTAGIAMLGVIPGVVQGRVVQR